MHGPAGRVKLPCVRHLLILMYLRYIRPDLIIYFDQNYEIEILFFCSVWVFCLLKLTNPRAVKEEGTNSNFSQTITAESSHLQIASDRNPTGNLWFPKANC